VGVLWIVGDRFKTYWYILWTLPDSSFLANNYGHFQMYRSTAVAVGILVVCVALTFLGRKVLVAGAVALAAFAAFASVTITEKVSDPQLYNREQLGPGFLKVAGIKPGDNVVFDDAPDWTLRATQAFMINEGRVWMVDVDRAPVPPAATVVVTVLPEKGPVEAAWPKAPAGWHVVATDKDNKIAVWRR
jgi:hypothetical protein